MPRWPNSRCACNAQVWSNAALEELVGRLGGKVLMQQRNTLSLEVCDLVWPTKWRPGADQRGKAHSYEGGLVERI